MRRALSVVSLLMLSVALASCQFSQSEFASQAGKIGSEFAAAATTLRYVHEGRLLRGYADSSFQSYRSMLEGLGPQIPRMNGAPKGKRVERLVRLYRRAEKAVTHPCLDPGCDWRSQLRALNEASHAFQRASQG